MNISLVSLKAVDVSGCDRVCAYRRPARKEATQEEYSDDLFQLAYADDQEKLLSRDLCVYSEEADINDHAIVSIEFANGVKATLFFSIFGSDTEDQETLEVVGSTGRLILTRHTGEIDCVQDHGTHRKVHECAGEEFSTSHFGADRELVRAMATFMHRGAAPPAGLEDAYRASRVAFEAQASLEDGTVHRLESKELDRR